MPILDQVANPAPDVSDGARLLRRRMLAVVDDVDRGLSDIRRIVQRFGRSALETEIGASDATEMLTLYNALKAVLESAEVSRTIDNIPS